jgi:predicted transcriptional regulator
MDPAKNLKEEAHRLVDQLPPDASGDDLMYEVYVRQAVEAGLEDVTAGRVVAHEEAVAKLRPRR